MSTLAQPTTRLLPLDHVLEPAEPVRSSFNESEQFALIESMRAVGQLQAIIVKPKGDRYEVVAGHRRLRAAIYLRWPTINATIMVGTQNDFDAAKCHENAFREAIQPEDEGRYFQYLARDKKMGIKEIARFSNRSHYYIESRLNCCTWPDDIRDALRNGIIGLGAAEALARISETAERSRLLSYAKADGISARTAQSWADAWEATKQSVDVETMKAAVAQINQKWEEPLFPCFGCERPTRLSQLQTIRLCGECHAELTNARNAPPDTHTQTTGANSPNTTEAGTRTQTPVNSPEGRESTPTNTATPPKDHI